ncbi:MAG: LL-diaminopimelate aminotransferase [Dehalococcoidia bacterium]|nr:LL-diaminopimelate aminotransferase [Dehalococcoidia bacterium]
MKFSQRLDQLAPYLFVEINKKIAEKKAKGEEVISFGIGDPDLPTPSNVIEKLCQAAHDPANHRYPETEGLPQFRQAVAAWYEKRFGVALDPATEVLPLIGSKEGIGHIAFCLLDAGDIALVPDPAYPVYAVGTTLAGGTPYYLPLRAERDFLPDLAAVPPEVLAKTKLLWLNYPNNPTGAVAGLDFFRQAVEFAGKHDLAICHDGPYSEVTYGGYQAPSFLQVEGAKKVGIEFHSFSKTYNMTGWRVGMAVGNAQMIDALKRFKSNLDSGVPQAIQLAAIEALNGPQDAVAQHNAVYLRRRDLVAEVLSDIGCTVEPPKASLYIWAKVPPNYTSVEFAAELLDQVGVLVIPGTGYGPAGEGYVRLSLTISDAALVRALSKLQSWQDNRNRFKPKH